MNSWIRVLASLREGAWLVRERVVFYSAMSLVGLVLAAGVLVGTTPAGLEHFRFGKDFSSAWAAGSLALEGHAERAYEPTALRRVEQSVFRDETAGYYAWFYPPVFLLFAAVLALMPYGVALVAWQGVTAAAYVAALRRLWPDRGTALVALAWPGVFVNLLYGQNAFLSTALLGAGLALLEARPLAAGVLLGSLCYKPQLAVLVPFATLAGGHWRAFAAAAATVAGLCAASAVLFGAPAWTAFLAASPATRAALEGGAVDFHHMVTVFAAARLLGAGVAAAWSLQLASSLAMAAAVVVAWRSAAPPGVKKALLVAATPLATPFALVYDLLIEALAVAWLAREGIRTGFRPWERALIVLVALLPALAFVLAREYALPVAPLVQLLLVLALLRRAARA